VRLLPAVDGGGVLDAGRVRAPHALGAPAVTALLHRSRVRPAVRHMALLWLRRLDDDATSGALWHRPVAFVPIYLILCVLLGAVIGYAGGVGFALTQPNTSIRPGPEGEPVTVANDYTAVPMISGLGGALIGLLVGGLLAARRWRRSQ
jgi:hypothetical protein